MMKVCVLLMYNACKGKTISVQAWVGTGGGGVKVFRIFRQWAHVWSMMVIRLSALRTGRLYSQGNSLVLISVRGRMDPRTTKCGQNDLVTRNFSVTPSGIETGTSYLLVQCLDQFRHLHHHLLSCISRITNNRFPVII
jgi:hypothetical protein